MSKTFLTEYTHNGRRFGDDVQAETEKEALRIVAARGRGEFIVGELAVSIPVDRMDTDRAQRIIAALSDRLQGTVH